jgi:hypothetical protein
MIAVPTGEPVEALTLEEPVPPPGSDAIRTAHPGNTTAAKAMTERIPRTAFRLARTDALG